ncbi:unnamed protein product [marine sediment metagenome]|uniref:Endonuclease/exonuclease/phosphatase domain-containing protein n=1 Tax=marine sediment metagenome TaxID=412755 RepID=X1DEH3_9ZZZZ
MRLVTYNIQYSRGKDDQFDIARVVDAVKDADIIALQEVDRFWLRTGMVDQPAEIAVRYLYLGDFVRHESAPSTR